MAADREIFGEASRLSGAGRSFALVSILSTSGSTPRSEGRMLVREDGSTLGTVGGGILESTARDEALEALRAQKSGILEFNLDSGPGGKALDMLCGGRVTLAVDVVKGRRSLVIVGAGHVGLALARLADFLGFRITVADERAELCQPERFPASTELVTGKSLETLLETLGNRPASAIVIATQAEDERAVRSIAARDWAYVGMLGSRAKVTRLFAKLAAEGIDPGWLNTIRAPVGLDVGAETPEEIALSTLTEVMAVMNGSDCLPLYVKARKD